MHKLLKILFFLQQARALTRGRGDDAGYRGYTRSRAYHPFYRSHRRSLAARLLSALARRKH